MNTIKTGDTVELNGHRALVVEAFEDDLLVVWTHIKEHGNVPFIWDGDFRLHAVARCANDSLQRFKKITTGEVAHHA